MNFTQEDIDSAVQELGTDIARVLDNYMETSEKGEEFVKATVMTVLTKALVAAVIAYKLPPGFVVRALRGYFEDFDLSDEAIH